MRCNRSKDFLKAQFVLLVIKIRLYKQPRCVLSSEYLLIHTAQNSLKIKWVEIKIFRTILTKKMSLKNNKNKTRSFIDLSKTNSMAWPYWSFSITLKVILSLSDRYKIFKMQFLVKSISVTTINKRLWNR